jgi:hypothetical protein
VSASATIPALWTQYAATGERAYFSSPRFAKSWHRSGSPWSVGSQDVPTASSSLGNAANNLDLLYTFNDYSRVTQVIRRHPDLIDPLIECYIKAEEYFDVSIGLRLDLLDDPDQGEPRLFILILTDLPVSDARNRLRCFDEDWWIKRSDETLSKLSVDVEYV